MISSIKITFSATTNQDSNLMTLGYISLFPLHITFLVLLMLTLYWKFMAFSMIYLEHLIVWHDGLLYNLINKGVDSNLFKFITSFLNNRCQQVVLNGQYSVWKLVTAGVLQVSVLGPLFSLIYVNDLPLGLAINIKLFSDDTFLFFSCKWRQCFCL